MDEQMSDEINIIGISYTSTELNISQKQVAIVLDFMKKQNATVPFISRYRKEAHGSLDEVQIAKIGETYDSYLEREKRRKFILETIDECNLKQNTIVILQADHGTGVGEKHGEMFYGAFTYDSTSNVFSMIHIPGFESNQISSQCQNIDFFPTIAEMISFPKDNLDPRLQGKTLFPLIEETEKIERPSFIETGGLYGPWPSPKKHNVFAIRFNRKKLIFNDTPETWEFYDLDTDPNEEKNVYDEESNEIKILKSKLIAHLESNNVQTKIS